MSSWDGGWEEAVDSGDLEDWILGDEVDGADLDVDDVDQAVADADGEEVDVGALPDPSLADADKAGTPVTPQQNGSPNLARPTEASRPPALTPVETVYAGCRFRSRIEARWAVFFDALGLDWEFEPEGFELPSGRRYLPDFWLPHANTWFEVKGNRRPKRVERETLGEFAASLPGADHRRYSEIMSRDFLEHSQYLKVSVGGIPRPGRVAQWVRENRATQSRWRSADEWSPGWIWRVLSINGETSVAARWWNRCQYGHTWVGWGWCWRCQIEDSHRDPYWATYEIHPDITRALHKARAARFEHDARESW